MERVAAITGDNPPALATRPELAPWLAAYVEAYNLLSASRQSGFGGPQAITLGEIDAFCRLLGWRGTEELADLVEVIQAMDAAYLEVATQRTEERRESVRDRSVEASRRPRSRQWGD